MSSLRPRLSQNSKPANERSAIDSSPQRPVTTLRWTRTDEYDWTEQDLEFARADGVDTSDPEALFWWLNPQGTRWPVMTRPVVETYEFVNPWGPPHTPRFVMAHNTTGLLHPMQSDSAPVVFTRRIQSHRCPLGHQPSPVPGDLRCDCGMYLYSDLK